jgi:uncharacterized protein YcaQ
MTELELQHLRREKWHVDGEPVHTLEQARQFVDSVGMSLLYPLGPMPLIPTFVGAIAGSDRNLPERKNAAANAHALQAQELLTRMASSKSVFQAQFGTETLLLSPTVFPYYYALASDRNPRQPIRRRAGGKGSPLVEHAFRELEEHGPLTLKQLQEMLGGSLSESAIGHALHELWTALKITPVDHDADAGERWDVYFRWAPHEIEEAVRVSDAEALSALISKYLDAVVAATQEEIENFFSPIVSRTRVAQVIRALLDAREFVYTPSENRTLITVAHSGLSSASPRPRSERSAPSFTPRRRNG